MSWKFETSLERIKKKYEETADLEVSKLSREMDFENIGLKHPKKIRGAHLYIDVVNLREIQSETFGQAGEEEEFLRRMHIYGRELTRITEEDFTSAKVHFQGPKLHAVTYRPIDQDDDIVAQAVTLAAAVALSVDKAFNILFDGYEFEIAAGIDLGDAVATKNNVKGDRELLFLGKPANVAAKIVNTGIRITSRVAEVLPESFIDFLTDKGDDVFEGELPGDFVDEQVTEYEWSWSLAQSKERLEEAIEQFPEGCANIADAQGEIEKNKLSLSNSKRVDGVSIFADVDGFTQYVDEAYAVDEDLKEAVRAYHVFRSEMRYCAVEDSGALRIQYQGDRMQALDFLPINDDAAIAMSAIDVAGALNASVTHTLPEVIPNAVRKLAIGQSMGRTLISRLGEHGQPDVMCLGPATSEAAEFQLSLEGGETGISGKIRDLLPEEIASEFTWDSVRNCYIAKDLTADRLERAYQATEADRAAKLKSVNVTKERSDISGRPWQR